MTRILVEALARRHDRSEFDCGHAELNDFLRLRAGQYERRDFARTVVATEEGRASVLGYFTLAAGSVAYNALPDEVRDGSPKHRAPVVLLARLAVDLRYRGRKLGEGLLIEALRRTVEVSRLAGVYGVEVQAVDDAARSFYLKYGFAALSDDSLHLYLTTKAAVKILES